MTNILKNTNDKITNAFKNQVVGSIPSFTILLTCQSMIVFQKATT